MRALEAKGFRGFGFTAFGFSGLGCRVYEFRLWGDWVLGVFEFRVYGSRVLAVQGLLLRDSILDSPMLCAPVDKVSGAKTDWNVGQAVQNILVLRPFKKEGLTDQGYAFRNTWSQDFSK